MDADYDELTSRPCGMCNLNYWDGRAYDNFY